MASRLAEASRAALSEGGDLARNIDAFAPRTAQQDLSAAIADAFETRGTLIAEAGTGTGKTFAYLVPALLSGLKTIISTGTRALQDQLYHRDLPRVRDALGRGLKTALLKGRANYLCLYRLNQAKGEPKFSSREQIAQFQRIVAWSGRTRMGDLAELEALPEDSPLLPMVTSTADNCLGSECPFFGDCFVVQARQRAQAADLVVVNHHLLLADLALKQEGFGEILPGAQAFVVDEAHQLPDLAAQFFGEALSARPLVELARDASPNARTSPVRWPRSRGRRANWSMRCVHCVRRWTNCRCVARAGVRPNWTTSEQAFDVLEAALSQLHAASCRCANLAGVRQLHRACAGFRRALQRWRGEARRTSRATDFDMPFDEPDRRRRGDAGADSSEPAATTPACTGTNSPRAASG